jgi:HEAT repeat protein
MVVMMTRESKMAGIAVLILVSGLSAHGGQYRGPGSGLPVRAPIFPVRTPAPSAANPTTGARDLVAFSRTWQTWWEFNKEPYLKSRVRGIKAPITGSDDFYLGPRRSGQLIDVLRATAKDREDSITPALVALLEAERNRDIQSACLIALGKVGASAASVDLVKIISERIRRDDQEVRESAVLSLGIIGDKKAFPVLKSLFADERSGQRLADRDSVRKRTRAYAAYGLGLLARRIGDPSLSQQIFDLLWSNLQAKELKDRDLRTAIVNAIGSLRASTDRSADKRLAWQASEQLLEWFEEDRGATEESVQAHAAVAIGRILGRGNSRSHRICKERFASLLNAKKRRGPPILQSCAIALGMMSLPGEEHPDDKIYSEALRLHWKRGRDQAARQFSVMSLGRIGGKANRDWLAKTYSSANKSSEQPWLALSLGVHCGREADAGTPDEFIGDMLLRDLSRSSTDDQRSALAIAVGLTQCSAAVPEMLRLLQKHEGDTRTAAYLCIGLGLLRDRSAIKMLSDILDRSGRRPFLLQQCAVALGCLGDRDANDRLVRMLKDNDSVAVLAAIASAIGRIGDRRAIQPLVVLTEDRSISKLGRAFVAAALGGVGDKDELVWNVPLSIDCNYATGMDTLSNGRTGVLDIL